MVPKRVDPRSTLWRIVKAHTSRGLSKNTEVLLSPGIQGREPVLM